MFNKKDYERFAESLNCSEEVLFAIEQVSDSRFMTENTYRRIEEENVTAIGEKITENAAYQLWEEGGHEVQVLAALPTESGSGDFEEGDEIFWGEIKFAEFGAEKWVLSDSHDN